MFNFSYHQKMAILILGFFLTIGIIVNVNIKMRGKPIVWDGNIHFVEQVKKNTTPPQKKLFLFNPNTLSEDSFWMLDISNKAIRTMLNYRAKGGKFYRKEQLQKNKNLSHEEYLKILPYILLSAPNRNIAVIKISSPIDINRADSNQLSKLPIPHFLVSKIIAYRNQLGGYYTIAQLKEVYYLTNTIFDKIKNHVTCDTHAIVKQNINTIKPELLARHPYLNYKWANAIATYRYKKVRIKNWNELQKIGLDTNSIHRLRIYFSL